MNTAPRQDTFDIDITAAMAESLASETPVVRTYLAPTLVAQLGGLPLEDDEQHIAANKLIIENRSRMVADRKAETKAKLAEKRAEIAALNAESNRLNTRDNRIISGSRAALKAMGAE